MLHIRLVVPPDLVAQVVATLKQAPEVINLWHMRGVVQKPIGDLVSCDVAKEGGTSLLSELRALGLEERGSIAVETVDASISRAALEAERVAPGSPADAIVWEEVENRVSESATLSVSFLLFMTIATMIGAIAIITDSIVLVIGAMVVGPEYGPLAGICVALVQGRPHFAARSLAALTAGFPLSIAAAWLLTLVLTGADLAPAEFRPEEHALTLFISRPNWYSAIVAILAGIVGMLALISAKSGPLIGVLISVTTIPAAANVGVAVAYGSWADAGGAAAQLGINVGAILVSGVIVLGVAHGYRRRREHTRSIEPDAHD